MEQNTSAIDRAFAKLEQEVATIEAKRAEDNEE